MSPYKAELAKLQNIAEHKEEYPIISFHMLEDNPLVTTNLSNS